MALDLPLQGFLTPSALQAVIVSIRIATYIGITILVVALSYKLEKVLSLKQEPCLQHKYDIAGDNA